MGFKLNIDEEVFRKRIDIAFNKPSYPYVSDAVIARIARDFYRGLIFSSYHIAPNDQAYLESIFLPIFTMTENQRLWLVDNQIFFFFEYLSQANKKSMIPYPCFPTVQVLNLADEMRLNEEWSLIKSAYGFAPGHNFIHKENEGSNCS